MANENTVYVLVKLSESSEGQDTHIEYIIGIYRTHARAMEAMIDQVKRKLQQECDMEIMEETVEE